MAKPESLSENHSTNPPQSQSQETESVQNTWSGFISKEFSGSKGYNGQWFRRPSRNEEKKDDPALYTYTNQFGEEYKKRYDVATYLSGSEFVPRRLLVQATPRVWEAQPNTRWRRTRLKGNVPSALKLSQWALDPLDPVYVTNDETGELQVKKRLFWGIMGAGLLVSIRTLLICIPLQLYLALPMSKSPWENEDVAVSYQNWPGYSWNWPKFAVNPLDMSPTSGLLTENLKFSAKPRLLRPRLLVTKDIDGQWTVKDIDANPSLWKPYIMLSYTNLHYHTNSSPEGREKLEQAAEMVAAESNCEAYWMDFKCRASTAEEKLLTSDVNRFCDVIRGARRIIVALPDNSSKTEMEWGNRMWTLPEGLLATGEDVYFHYTDMPTYKGPNLVPLTKVEMTSRIWEDGKRDGEQIQATRHLAEHFTGGIDLSRLQLFSLALRALSDRQGSESMDTGRPELAYALMGLLNIRIDADPDSETLFQSISRVCLVNDTDRLLERMLCLLPEGKHVSGDPFKELAQADQFQTHLWDIQPLCYVVGTGETDQTLIVDSARAIPIRWKNFPKLQYKRADGFLKFLAELFVRSGVAWFVGGLHLAWTYAPFLIALDDTNDVQALSSELRRWVGWAIMLFLLVSIALSFAGPACCRRLFGGQITEMTPHLVGFEGTLPLFELEKVIFGNFNNRLDYEPSSTAFAQRQTRERRGLEPKFVSHPDQYAPSPPLASPEHRLFTIVDTGNLTVSIIQAVAPPTVALICGREGGMLRALLCSWDFRDDLLHRETIVRLNSDCLDMAQTKSWLKVCLRANQAEAAAGK